MRSKDAPKQLARTSLIQFLKSIRLSEMSLRKFDFCVYNLAQLSKKRLPTILGDRRKSSLITIWLKSVQRQLRGRMRARDPWMIVRFTRDIPHRIFKVFLEVVRAAVSSFGVSCTETKVTDEISYVYKTEQTLTDCVSLQKNQSGLFFQRNQSA